MSTEDGRPFGKASSETEVAELPVAVVSRCDTANFAAPIGNDEDRSGTAAVAVVGLAAGASRSKTKSVRR